VVLPVLFLGLVNYSTHFLFPSLVRTWWGFLSLNLVLLAAVAAFSQTVFNLVQGTHTRLTQLYRELRERNEELARVNASAQRLVDQMRALDEASATVTEELALETVLQTVVDLSRGLLGAQYGALLVRREGDTIWFLTSGLAPAERTALGAPPMGRGLLGAVAEGKPIRIPEIAADPRSSGFPPNHPPMRSFLGVPISYRRRILGALYLTNKLGAPECTQSDEDVLMLFSRHAAIAIENARLYQRAQDVAVLEERERIAREMHDNFAQVLGYVSTKTQAARRLLASGDARMAETQMIQMEEAARQLYTDVREAILGLRSPLGRGYSFLQVLDEYLTRFGQVSEIRTRLDTSIGNGAIELPPRTEIQVFRIIQESLTNVRKHADATEATVRLQADPAALTIVVEDNGHGFEPSRIVRDDWPHFGLQTMRERAEAVGASLRVESAPGHGTRVIVRIPVSERPREPRGE
jgi:signal transduction histidine kinase